MKQPKPQNKVTARHHEEGRSPTDVIPPHWALSSNSGFTFIEVMIAAVIFLLAALAAMDLARGSTRAVRDAREISQATWLLQKTMTELETKLETEGIENGCEKKKEGKFDPPYEKFKFTSYCAEVDMKLSEATAQIMEASKSEDSRDNEPTKEDLLKKMILKSASDYISKATRELHVDIEWMQGKNPKKVDATTHFTRYDQAFQLPAMGMQ